MCGTRFMNKEWLHWLQWNHLVHLILHMFSLYFHCLMEHIPIRGIWSEHRQTHSNERYACARFFPRTDRVVVSFILSMVSGEHSFHSFKCFKQMNVWRLLTGTLHATVNICIEGLINAAADARVESSPTDMIWLCWKYRIWVMTCDFSFSAVFVM